MKLLCNILAAFCLLSVQVHAQRSAADEVKRLQNKMYKMYAGTDYDGFISVTDSLKDVALKAGDERAGSTRENTAPFNMCSSLSSV